MATKNHLATEVTQRTVETLLKEVSEQSRNYERALRKLLRGKPGTEACDGNLGRVWAEAEVLPLKPNKPRWQSMSTATLFRID